MNPPTITPRAFCESSSYLKLELSPLIAALMDAIAGIRPTTIDDDECVRFFGCTLDALPPRRRILALAGGARGGKSSRCGIPLLLFGAWTVAAPDAIRGEVLSAPIICPDLDLGAQSLSYASGYIDGSPVLRAAREDEDKDSITLRRPWDNRLVRIERRAAARGGRTARARSITSALLDESAFFRDPDSGVVNDVDIHNAVYPRLLAGGFEAIVSTRWIAHQGILESRVDADFGHHEHALVCVAGTRALNPNWDPTGELEADIREQSADNAAREIDGIALAGGAGMFFDGDAITAAIDLSRPLELERRDHAVYAAGGDFAFRSDASAVAVAQRIDKQYALACFDEMKPSKGSPLKPSVVVGAFASTLRRYGVTSLMCDGHYREAVDEHLQAQKLHLVAAPEGADGKSQSYTFFRSLLHEGRLSLPNSPRLIRQLRDVVSKPIPGGGIRISSPRRAGGGHGDLVSAAVLAVWAARASITTSAYSDIRKYLADNNFQLPRSRTADSPSGFSMRPDHSGDKPRRY